MRIGVGLSIPELATRGGKFSPLSLFSSGVQGAWYDPSDYSTLFQDSVGTTPVTAVEQPVGLMLDKSQGLVLGSELVTNGDFATDTAWSKSANTTISGGLATTTGTGAFGGIVSQNIVLTAGKSYKITITTFKTSGSALVFGVGAQNFLTNINGSSTYTAIVNSTAGGTLLLSIFEGSGSNWVGSIDNISVKELAGNHATQATAASRPVLRSRYNLLTYSEDYTNAIWTKGGTATAPSANSLTFPAVNDYVWQQLSPAANYAGKQVTGSVLLSGSGTVAIGYYDNVSAFQTDVITLTATPTRYTVTKTIGAGAVDVRFIVAGRIGAATATAVTANQAQVVFGSSAGTYQQITTATSYATAGFLPYLALDGADDSFATNSINFTATDKMAVVAGVTKLSDAAAGNIVELSATFASNAGAFVLQGPDGAANPSYYFGISGTSLARYSPNTYPAPITNVLAVQYDIGGTLISDEIKPRINGVLNQTNPGGTVGGTGNFGNYPLYIGRRGGSTLPFNGRIYQMVICGKALSASELASTEAYVNSKTGAY